MMRPILFFLVFVLVSPVHAEMVLKTFNLQHRNAADVINVLKPMLDSGGSISGSGYKLFIKSTPQNLRQLSKMLAQIDVAPKDLIISVTTDPVVMHKRQRLSVQVAPSANPTPKVSMGSSYVRARRRIMYDAKLFEQPHTERNPQILKVRVSEGLWATIKTGQAVPVASRARNPDGSVTDTYTYEAVASGFQILPQVNGNNVTLTVRPQAQSLNNNAAGTYSTTEMNTTVSGVLGKWIALGSVAQTQQGQSTGIGYSTERQSVSNIQIFVKVQLAKP